MIKIKRGLDLPIVGAPDQKITEGPKISKVAVVGTDYVGMKPTMHVKEGDLVKEGQLLFEDKKTAGVRFTSPAHGTVVAINRGERRAFESLVINIQGDQAVQFKSHKGADVKNYDGQSIKDLLLESGEWTALRMRPYAKVPSAESVAHSIFVTAIDTNPLAADPAVIINESKQEFIIGLQALKKLTSGKLFLCTAPNADIPNAEVAESRQFKGPHPAGLPGTHIHFLDPVSANKSVWYIGYQDVIAIGHLIRTSKRYLGRVVAVAGPAAKNPRLVKTRFGANIEELTKDEIFPDDVRCISGSVFAGRTARGAFAFLGRYHNQVSLLEEGRKREFLGWHSPGFNKFSVKSIYLSRLLPKKKFAFNTSVNGSHRSVVPIGSYEKVMPLDIMPTHLLKAILSKDTDQAQKLGVLELDEEDLALCSFVDPCKHEFGPILRENLDLIEKEG